MIVTSKIKLDMAQPGTANPVFAVQGDGNTRAVEAELLTNGSSWAPDDGWEAAITYRKPDGTKGLYNLLDDGSSAINISGSTATVILAQQMMTVPGTVRAAIVFNNQRLDQLTSFPFFVSVARNQFAGAQQSEDYIRLQWLEDKLEEYLRKAADSGAFDGAPGADGHTPVYGVDYGTPEQIAGIANQAAEILQPEVNQIKDDLSTKIDKPSAAPEVGKILKVTSVNDDGTFVCEWADAPSGGGKMEKYQPELLSSVINEAKTGLSHCDLGVKISDLIKLKSFMLITNCPEGFGGRFGISCTADYGSTGNFAVFHPYPKYIAILLRKIDGSTFGAYKWVNTTTIYTYEQDPNSPQAGTLLSWSQHPSFVYCGEFSFDRKNIDVQDKNLCVFSQIQSGEYAAELWALTKEE